ncbi:MAG: pyrroloquinoline quinone-dependent dehydrogenase [Vicinamibacterales bacterium]
MGGGYRSIALRLVAAILATLFVAVGLHAQRPAAAGSSRVDRDWPAYGGGPEQARYSTIAQIDRTNVAQLQVAWTYDSGESGGLQTNPIVADGIVYTTTPRHKVVALDGATGAVRWTFDSGIDGRGPNRGVARWAADGERRIFTGQGQYIYALDAASGEPLREFGRDGRIDLRDELGREPAAQSVLLTTPGVVYRNLLIVGGRVSEGLPASPGFIRAYDVKTGALRWMFRTIPGKGEFGYETWPAEAWTYTGGVNNWAGMAVDERRGIVFVPTGSAAADFYGANRLGDNLFANSLIAIEAATGKRLWHFQAVRHDIWDRDFPSPPTLVTVTRDGRSIDAVAQTTKHGFLFLFNRENGEPLFPIEYRAFPPSDVDGERASETQAVPLQPVPFARQRLTEEMLTTRTPAAHQAVLEAFRTFRNGGPFTPLSVGKQTVVLPGFDGGAEWGGSAFDPATGLLYVNANEMAWTGGLAPNDGGANGRQVYLRECATCHRDDLMGSPPQIPSLIGVGDRKSAAELTTVVGQGAGRMPAYPALSADVVAALTRYLQTGRSEIVADTPSPVAVKYRFTGYRKFLDPDGYPAVTPPWGTLNAINLNTGEYAWAIPLGEYPELAAQGMRNTGSENYGGPIVTAGGLVFIGATSFDRKFRAFDKATGALLWETTLPFSGNGTPSTYEVAGRQFIVVPAGGGKAAAGVPSGGVYVAFALPLRQ